MTVLEVIQSTPGLDAVQANTVYKALIDRAVDGLVDYTLDLKESVDLVIADCYTLLANIPDFSEGQLSIKYDRKTLLQMADSIYRKYDETFGKIKAVQLW